MPGPRGGTFIIVSSLPRQGIAKGDTDSIANAIKMAIDDVHGRVGGATIQYEDWDDATAARGTWDPTVEASNARRAASDPNVVAYIGPYSSDAAKISIPILCKVNVGMISPSATYPGLTRAIPDVTASGEPASYYPGCTPNFARDIPTDDVQGAAAAAWAKSLGATSAYVLDDGTPYGHGLALAFADTAKQVGLDLAGGPDSIDLKAASYAPTAATVKASGANVVYFGGVAENNAGPLWQALHSALGTSVKLMGSDGLDETAFLDAAGSAAEGTYITRGVVPAARLGGAANAWVDRYRQEFNAEPSDYAAYAYDATGAVLAAIQKAATQDRARIRQDLMATRDYRGILGTWSFTSTGDTTLRAVSGLQVKNGAFDTEQAQVLSAP